MVLNSLLTDRFFFFFEKKMDLKSRRNRTIVFFGTSVVDWKRRLNR